MGNGIKKLCSVSVGADVFSKDWRHCDQLANYMARMVSFDKPDPFIFSNLLSTVLNEIIEALFLNHSGSKEIRISLSRVNGDTVVEAEAPVDETSKLFYVKMALDLRSGDPSEIYRKEIMKAENVSRAIGFFELASDYQADISVDGAASDRVKLIVRIGLDKLAEASYQ